MKPLIPCLITGLVLPVVARAELPRTAMSDQSQAARGNNAFAIELYGQLHKRSGNLFFSPESISTVLAMVYAGARADTAAQMWSSEITPEDDQKTAWFNNPGVSANKVDTFLFRLKENADYLDRLELRVQYRALRLQGR